MGTNNRFFKIIWDIRQGRSSGCLCNQRRQTGTPSPVTRKHPDRWNNVRGSRWSTRGFPRCIKSSNEAHAGDENVYRKLVGKACREAVTGIYPDLRLDYSQIPLAVGRLQLPVDIKLHFESLSHTDTFSWNTQLVYPSQPGSDNDKMNIVCFDSDHPAEVKTFGSCTRAACKVVISLDGDW